MDQRLQVIYTSDLERQLRQKPLWNRLKILKEYEELTKIEAALKRTFQY